MRHTPSCPSSSRSALTVISNRFQPASTSHSYCSSHFHSKPVAGSVGSKKFLCSRRCASSRSRSCSRPASSWIPWSDGTSHLLLSPMELLEKLAALVPPPRLHHLRYHGVLAPRARDRGRIVPTKPVAEPAAADGDTSAPSCAHRLGWAGPAGPGVGRRPQRMRSLWRAPEDHRRPDRSDFDPDLSGRGRVAGGAPAEGPAAAAVRVRGLPSPPFAPGAVSRREKCVLKGLIEYRIGPDTGPQAIQPYCEPCPRTCKRSSASLPCPLGVFGALTRGPKRCLILPILHPLYAHGQDGGGQGYLGEDQGSASVS